MQKAKQCIIAAHGYILIVKEAVIANGNTCTHFKRCVFESGFCERKESPLIVEC
jgi:hypothetical protein